MNKRIIFISDFFSAHVLGGAEINDDELISMLGSTDFNTIKKQSHLITLDFIKKNKNSFFIISNFTNLSYKCKKYLRNLNYIIYEHDHKYLRTRNPLNYKDFKATDKDILNYHFYKNAKAILCQSSFHKGIIEKNLGFNNIISLGGNLWSLSSLEKMREISLKDKKNCHSILLSPNDHKNTKETIRYCNTKGLLFELISDNNYFNFLEKIGSNKKLVFFPKTPETLSRIVVEARMMGCSVILNNNIGASKEDWFHLKGNDLIDYMIQKRTDIFETVLKLIGQEYKIIERPAVSILTTFHKGEEFLNNFMDNITNQSFFNSCELLIADAASPDGEREIINSYIKSNDNIKYIRIEEKLLPSPCFNMLMKEASGDYLTFAFIDDVKSIDCIKNLYEEIILNKDASLVYGDVLETSVPNQKFEKADLDGRLMEHSTFQFSKENMIKCLPGPMPLWDTQIHEECGFLDLENCNFADDWDMWLRAVDHGFKFKKINKIVGLYLLGGRSQQENIDQRTEEANIFFKYSHIFGSNYNKFAPYFNQFLRRNNG